MSIHNICDIQFNFNLFICCKTCVHRFCFRVLLTPFCIQPLVLLTVPVAAVHIRGYMLKK